MIIIDFDLNGSKISVKLVFVSLGRFAFAQKCFWSRNRQMFQHFGALIIGLTQKDGLMNG